MKIQDQKCYHIFNRGNNKGPIFFSPHNYDYFLYKFNKYVGPYSEVYAYSLMPNHFHFALKVNDKKKFEQGIKNFFISYVKSINTVYDRVGGLFQGRYKAIEVNSDLYFESLIRYIHSNAVTAQLVDRLEDHEFSSYNDYLYNTKTFISKDKVLEHFGGIENFLAYHNNISEN